MATFCRSTYDSYTAAILRKRHPVTDDARAEFERLVGELRPKLHRYCARMTGSAIDGEDIVQDALLKALASLPNVGVEQGPVAVPNDGGKEPGQSGPDDVEAPPLPPHSLGGRGPTEARSGARDGGRGREARPHPAQPEIHRVLKVLGAREGAPGKPFEQ